MIFFLFPGSCAGTKFNSPRSPSPSRQGNGRKQARLRPTAACFSRSFSNAHRKVRRALKGRTPAQMWQWHGKGWTMSGDFKFGIEEEFFLVDGETKSVSREMPRGFLERVKAATGGQVKG